jgi:hypothetical protein
MLPIIGWKNPVRSVPMAIASLSIAAYSSVARMSREADFIIQQALVLKSRVSSMPLMESGTGRMINLVA